MENDFAVIVSVMEPIFKRPNRHPLLRFTLFLEGYTVVSSRTRSPRPETLFACMTHSFACPLPHAGTEKMYFNRW